MKNIYCILIIVVLMSCGNNPKTDNNETKIPGEETKLVKEKLDPMLVQGVVDIVQTEEHLKYPEIPLSESSIVIAFIVDSEKTNIYFSDSIVSINYNVFIKYDNPYYKGILDINGVNVAIVDYGGFGNQYYNADSIRQIPLESFKSYPMKYISMKMFFVRNGELIHWNP